MKTLQYLVLLLVVNCAHGDIISGLYYSGTSGQTKAFVSQGKTETILSGVEGFSITGEAFGTSVEISMTDFAIIPNFRWVATNFDSGNGNALSVGHYTNATRYTFNTSGEPGLEFVMDGRGNNTVSGEFQVLEIVRSPTTGSLQKFAADFVQRGDNGVPEFGSVRFNSEIPFTTVPEASTTSMFILATLLLFGRRKK